MKNQDSALQLYMNYVLKAEISPLISQITNEIPRTFQDTIRSAKQKSTKKPKSPEELELRESLGKILHQTTKKANLLTPKAKTNLENFIQGEIVIEVAHQPKILGGERFILNKIACGGEMSQNIPNSVPIFYIADYDKVHNELTKTHFPLINSPTGFSIGIDQEIEKCYEDKCIECLPLPSMTHFKKIFHEIEKKYFFSINFIDSFGHQHK